MGANHYYHTLWRKIIVVVLVLVFFVNTICLSFTANAVDANLSDADIPVSATGDAETYSVFREEIIDSDNVGEMETGVDIDVVGNQTDMDDVDLGVISESDFEASLSTIVDGEAHEFYGSLVDMCNMANDSTGGTVTLFTDVSIFNQYIFCTAHDYTINLNGHTVTMDSTAAADAISISGNVTLTIEDRDVSTGEINKPVITDSLVGSLPADMSTSLSTFKTWNLQNAAWSEATKTMTYYTVEATDTPTKVRHTSDMSSMGSIVSQSGRLIHTSNNAKLVINGGYYTSKNNIILTVDEVPNASIWTYVVSISDAWFINSFRVGVLNLPVTLRDSYIVNNTCSTSLVSAAYFGTIDAENLLVANNNASSIFYQQSVLQLRNSMFTCNATTGTSGVIALISSYNYAATITDCVVSGNYGGKSGNDGTSTVSGAAAGISAKNAQSGVIIKDTKLVANYGSGNGVAFQSQWTRATPTYINLDRVEMKYNYATSRAPAVGLVSAPITMRSCVVSNNYAAVKCGAMRFEQGSVATIIDSDLSYNIGNQGVGCLYTSASDVTFVRTKINNNKTVVTNSNDGANVQVDGTSTCSLQDCEVKDNGARGAKGGGIYALAGAKLGMNNVTISGNRAGEGSGIYALAGATMTVQGKIVIDDNYINATATEDNLNIVNGTYLSQVGPLSDGSSIGVTSRTAPTATAVVLVMVGDYVEEAESMFFSDSEKYETSNDNGAIVLSLYVEVPPNVDFDGVMFQYYINLRVPLTYDPDAVMLNLLVMNKGNLPQNGKSNAADYLYLDPDTGSIKMTTRLTSMYSYRVFPLDQCTSLSAVNRFTDLDRLGWDLYELWVLKPGKKQFSTERKDWTIYSCTDDFDISTLNLQDKDCVRLVCNPKESDKSLDVTFYDYDVTDGNVYPTFDDASSKTNPSGMSTYDKSSGVWLATSVEGINSAANVAGQTGSVQYAFGNANHGIKFWNQKIFNSQPNKWNNDGTVGGCFFGLVTGLDKNYNLIWRSGINAPNIFGTDDGTIGKTVFDDYALRFNRVGSTYTLEDVLLVDDDGGMTEVLSDLSTMNNPSYGETLWNTIWTNNFWPMDTNGIIGTDGHDPLEGAYDTHENALLQHTDFSRSDYNYPASDDGLDHNAFFGMHMALTFALAEDYEAPLEYYFFGDDDMWVFLDGKLICDIGGIHSSMGAFVDIRQYIEVGDTDQHRFDVYYTERGASGSTCWMQFTLPATVDTTESFTFGKVDQLGHDVKGATFGLYSDSDCTDELSSHVSDFSGDVVVTGLLPDETYYIKETQASDGFQLADTVYELKKVDDKWRMYVFGDTNMRPVTGVINIDLSQPAFKMPETGGPGTLPVMLAGTCLIVLALAMLSYRKKRTQ